MIKRGIGAERASKIVGNAPGNIVEMIILEAPVKIIGKTEACGTRFLTPVVIMPIPAGITGYIVEHIKRAALPGFDAPPVIRIEKGIGRLVGIHKIPG
jgi:hypothetical protein